MKKYLFFAALFMLSISIHAQEKKTWNFEAGLSEETIANLKADAANWADNGTDAEGNVNNWKNSVKQSADSYWMANGVVIEELRGLLIDIGSNKDNSVHLATTKVRLTRKSTKITFPKLANGQTIKIVGRSANGTATNRGIAPTKDYLKFQASESSPLYDGQCIFVGNQVEGSEGTYTFVWKVETDSPDSVDVQFQLTPDGGIDFTLFQIDNGDGPKVEGPQPVGYLYSGDIDSDNIYGVLDGSSNFAVTAIDVTNTTADADSLRKYQAVVIASSIAPTDAYVNTLKDVVAYVPTLNLNTAIYETLGYGKAVESTTGTLTVKTENETLFEGIDTENGIDLLPNGVITGVELSDYFASDDIIATAGDVVAMHMHNAKRNAYLLLPLSAEDLMNSDPDLVIALLPQALQTVLDTKKDVVAVGKPNISLALNNGSTTVSITANNSQAIYYTIDGSEPTVASTLYTEPFTLNQAATVKALAVADGYLDSEIVSKEVSIQVNTAAPEISLNREQGKTTITISSATEGAKLYFNFNNAQTPALSQEYTEPIVLTEPAMIYAMASAEGYLNSEISSKYVGIDGIDAQTIRLDTLSHFDANQTDWFINDETVEGAGNASAYYFWGKNAWNYYSEEVDHEETVKGSDGQDSTVIVYKPNPESLMVINPLNENGWVLKSQGQVLTGELQLKPDGGGVGNGVAGRFVDEAIDYIGTITTGVITFGAKKDGEPYTGRIESTVKYAGPFDVVVFCGNGNGSGAGILEIQTSVDGENWATVDTLKLASTQRYIKRTRASYEGTDEVYVRIAQVGGGTKAQVYDIYLLNNGELSKAYTEEAAGITTIEPAGEVVRTEVYSLDGTRVGKSGRGISIVRQTYANGSVVTKKVILK